MTTKISKKPLSLVVLLTLFIFSTHPAQAANTRNELIKDSQRRQALQQSAKVWFERNVLPSLGSTLDSLSSYGVSVRERGVTLPPELGGPRNLVEVVLEAQFSGWIDGGQFGYHSRNGYDRGGYDRHGRWRGFPDYGGSVNCYFSQKLWADIDSRGKPTRIRNGQRPVYVVACRSI